MEIRLDIGSEIIKFEDNSEFYRELIAKRKADGIIAEKKPLISIIIPAYNVEKYIDRCMESIVGQTIGIDNIQVIVVIDDASIDFTLEKTREWEKKFPKNILLITYAENIRQGGARNVGLCYADAEYIGFVDSDDWIEPDMYEVLYEKTKEKKWYAVRGKCIRDNYDPPEQNSDKFSVIKYEFKKKNGFYREEFLNTGKKGQFGNFWGGIYLKSVIIENDVWFPEKLAYEDSYWWSLVLLYIKNICIVDKILYHYWFLDESSDSQKRNSEHHLDILYIEIMVIEEYKKRGAFETFYLLFEYEFLQKFYLNTLYKLFRLFDYIPDVMGFMKETIYDYFPNFMNEVDFSKYTEVDQRLLKLLLIDGDISIEMMNAIKNAYLKVVDKARKMGYKA